MGGAAIAPPAEQLDALVARLETLRAAASGPRLLIGIAGAPGSGKTTLAQALVRRLAGRDDWRDSPVAHVPMDGYHLADRELARLGLLERKGAPGTFDAAGFAALLARIRAGETVWGPDFERDLEQPIAQSLPVTPYTRTVVSEGNYLLLPDDPWPVVRAQFDEVWFCRTDPQLRRARLVERHVRFGKPAAVAQAWVDEVDETNAALVEATLPAADLVVDVG